MISRKIQKWLDNTDFSESSDSDDNINGVKVDIYQDSEPYSTDITQRMHLTDHGISFIRKGIKEMSYDHWVGCYWGEWTIYD